MNLQRPLTLCCFVQLCHLAMAQNGSAYSYALPDPGIIQALHAAPFPGGGSLERSNTDQSPQMIRLDENGEVLWSENLAPSGDSLIWFVTASEVTGSGTSFLVGTLRSVGTNMPYACAVVALDPDGAVQWGKRFHVDSHPYALYPFGPPLVSLTTNGHVQVVLRYEWQYANRITVLELDNDGLLLSSKSYRTSSQPDQKCYAGAIVETPNGTLIAGVTNTEIYLLRSNADGMPLWDRRIDFSLYPEVYSAVALPDGGFVISGNLDDIYPEVFAMKVDSAGTLQWMKRYGDAGNTRGFWNMLSAGDGKVWGGQNSVWGPRVIRLTADGEVDYATTFDLPSNNTGCFSPTVLHVNENEVVASVYGHSVCGDAESVALSLLRTGIGANSTCLDLPVTITASPVSGVSVLGVVTTLNDETTTVSDLSINVTPIEVPRYSLCQNASVGTISTSAHTALAISPSLVIAGSRFSVSTAAEADHIHVLDALGRIVINEAVHPGEYQVEISSQLLTSGLYHVRSLRAGHVIGMGRVMIH